MRERKQYNNRHVRLMRKSGMAPLKSPRRVIGTCEQGKGSVLQDSAQFHQLIPAGRRPPSSLGVAVPHHGEAAANMTQLHCCGNRLTDLKPHFPCLLSALISLAPVWASA